MPHLLFIKQNLNEEHSYHLEELDVSDARILSSTTIKSIVTHLKNLENLSTSRCYGIVPSAYLELTDCRNLKYLNVFGVMTEGALGELKSCLSSIDINECSFSSVARPTVGLKRTSIWNQRTRENLTNLSLNALSK